MTANPNPNDRSEIEDLKARVDLVELIRQSGVELAGAGKSFMGRCPFHDDSTASLAVNPTENLWNCFGCEAGGDALKYLQLKEKLDFPQALERLKELVPPGSNGTVQIPRRDLLTRVAELYHARFLKSQEAQAYLKHRGLEAETWKAFRVGFCDGSLLKTLPQQGEVIEGLQELGLLTQDRKEHFRGCVVVPLTHPDKGVVGFYGRRIRPDAKICHLYLPGPRQGVVNWQGLKASTSITVAESVLDALLVASGVEGIHLRLRGPRADRGLQGPGEAFWRRGRHLMPGRRSRRAGGHSEILQGLPEFGPAGGRGATA